MDFSELNINHYLLFNNQDGIIYKSTFKSNQVHELHFSSLGSESRCRFPESNKERQDNGGKGMSAVYEKKIMQWKYCTVTCDLVETLQNGKVKRHNSLIPLSFTFAPPISNEFPSRHTTHLRENMRAKNVPRKTIPELHVKLKDGT